MCARDLKSRVQLSEGVRFGLKSRVQSTEDVTLDRIYICRALLKAKDTKSVNLI